MDEIKKTIDDVKEETIEKTTTVVDNAKSFWERNKKGILMGCGAAIGAAAIGTLGFLLGKGVGGHVDLIDASTLVVTDGGDDDSDEED